MTEERISWRQLTAYALPSVPVEAMFWLVVFYQLKFATDVVGLSPAVLGAIFGAARIWDAVLDPAAGWLSDRTETRFGRRRPWLAAAALPLGFAFAATWSPPEASAGGAVWLGVSLLAFYTAHTAFGIPHASLGAELARSHHERTRVFGVRAAFQGAGIVFGLAALFALEQAGDPRAVAARVGAALGALAVVCILVTAARVREPEGFAGRGGAHPWRAVADVLHNPHARRLLGVFFCAELATGLLSTAMPFATAYLLGDEGRTSLYLLAYLVPSLAFLPAWPAISRRVGKARAWCLATVAAAAGFGALYFLGRGDTLLALALCGVIGLFHGAGRVLPYSIQADVIDWDELRTGERKEGTYCAVWNLSSKLAAGISVAACGFVLAAAGFRAGATPSADGVLGIRLVTSVIPALLLCLAAWRLARFGLGEREHREIRAAIDARAAATGGLATAARLRAA